MHTVVIVDDEPPARAKLLRFLAPLPEFEVVAQADTVETAVAAITARKPDVLYLDIQLGAHSGFDVLEAIRGEESPHIVFTTAYSEYAVRAFDVQALDYLLKPYDRERFLRSIDRVKAALADPDRGDLEERVRRVLSAMPGQAAPIKQILIRDRAPTSFPSTASTGYQRPATTWRSTPAVKCT
jgi:two-component system LytT family response regulator